MTNNIWFTASPIAHLDVPEVIQVDNKKNLVQKIYDALHEAYPVPEDVRIFLRDGRSAVPRHEGRRPSCAVF